METVKPYLDIEIKEEGLKPFLEDFKKVLNLFLDGEIREEELADFSISIFVVNENLSESIEKLDVEILELRKAMDITHPDWDINQKKGHIEELIKLTDKLIEKHS